MNCNYNTIFAEAKAASRVLPTVSLDKRNAILLALADNIEANIDALIAANAADLQKMSPTNPLYDRLKLTPERIRAIADDTRHVANLSCPVGEEIEKRTLPNGLVLRRVRVPFGVVGVIYEARPNVTFDVFALCFKTANACLLKGGHDAENSNLAIIALIRDTLAAHGVDPNCAILMPPTHEATAALLDAVGTVDLCIPRGGRRLIDFVRQNAHVPVIETGAGVVHTYVHCDADIAMAKNIINNGKTRRVSVCNALDTLLVHRQMIDRLPELVSDLAEKDVELHVDAAALRALEGKYSGTLIPATDDTWDTEWMDYKMGIRVVDDLTAALSHIAQHGSGHSEAIITADSEAAQEFQDKVDAACVYVNAPTSFTDGGQFGLGAEIGISTQKLGPRGPMGLKALTTYKWLINGTGQIRKP